MRKVRFLPVLRHAFTMVRRTLKSYALLSVTIVLSFSLLLGYLLYTDASLYNKYKELFSWQRGELGFQDVDLNDAKLNAFLEKAASIGDTHSYLIYDAIGGELLTLYDIEGYDLQKFSCLTLDNWQLISIQDHAWPISNPFIFFDNFSDIIWLDGKEHTDITLGEGEALLPEDLYYAMGLNNMETPVYTFRFYYNITVTLRVVGLLRDTVHLTFDPETETLNNVDYVCRLVISSDTFNSTVLPDADYCRFVVIQTDSPEEVDQLCQQIMGYSADSTYKLQDEALEKIRTEKGTKAVIACALLLLLGINLYSSFTNALNDRKFEIGVKRAIGASSWSIVRQFLYESLIVMSANILISIALVTDIFLVYKYIYERTPDVYGNLDRWIIYISPHSAAMFAVCAVTLTIVFSLVFAYKSTRVEIVQYLKAE